MTLLLVATQTRSRVRDTLRTVRVIEQTLYEGLIKPQEINVAFRQECERQVQGLKNLTADDRRLMWEYYDKLDQGFDSTKCIPAGLNQLYALRVRQIRRAAHLHIRRVHPFRVRHLTVAA